MTQTPVDIAIVAPLAEEWSAMRDLLADHVPVNDSPLPAITGSVGSQSVVVVAGGKGEVNAAASVQFVSTHWQPRWILLVGIAGGFPKFGISRGDVVVGSFVYDMDFGKLVDGRYIRRPENDFAADRHLLAYAEVVGQDTMRDWQDSLLQVRPDGAPAGSSNFHVGYIVSGSKVVDDARQALFKAVLKTVSEVHAVEMEATGAGAAVRLEQSRRTVGFLTIRGISDVPKGAGGPSTSGTSQRAEWKRYAASVAASFTHSLIKRLPLWTDDGQGRHSVHSHPNSIEEIVNLAMRMREDVSAITAPDVDVLLARVRTTMRQEAIFGRTEASRAEIWQILYELHRIFLKDPGGSLLN